MLFHVTHRHTWEACPYHDAERARNTFGAAIAGVADTGATLVGAFVDGPAHTTFLLIEAEEASQIERALAPVIDVGWAETRPVVDFSDIMARVTED